MGAHGTLEWLPGKAVALTGACFPEAVVGPLPVFYPFLVSNPGEAAQAKRRIAAMTIGHLPPPLVNSELGGAAQELERLVDEYAIADGLDRRPRRMRLARLIIETAQRTGLASEAGVAGDLNPDEALRKIDAWLCDLKDIAVKDGLHVFGRMPDGEFRDPLGDQRRCGTRGFTHGARRQARARRTCRRAATRPTRRAADGAQSLHSRPAHAADADRF